MSLWSVIPSVPDRLVGVVVDREEWNRLLLQHSVDAGRLWRQARRSTQLTIEAIEALTDGAFNGLSISAYECGLWTPSPRQLMQLAEAYGVVPLTMLPDALVARLGP